jgi:serine/threonine protein phosphatase PrpC
VPRDHLVEHPAPWVAGVCDRGRRHPRNEDGMATAGDDPSGSFCALVVCDGVSTSKDSELASLAAARAACAVLAGAHADTPLDHEPVAFWSDRLREAGAAANAQAAAAAAEAGPATNPPSCTFVAAVVDGALIAAANVGDSRAYWLPESGPAMQLTTDDSWVTEELRRGAARSAAEADPRAHGITRWYGLDCPDDGVPTVATTAVDGAAGWLLVCSDGLWNYCSAPADLQAMINRIVTESGPDPVSLAEALVAWANEQGGHDNITVAVARLPARSGQSPVEQ